MACFPIFEASTHGDFVLVPVLPHTNMIGHGVQETMSKKKKFLTGKLTGNWHLTPNFHWILVRCVAAPIRFCSAFLQSPPVSVRHGTVRMASMLIAILNELIHLMKNILIERVWYFVATQFKVIQ